MDNISAGVDVAILEDILIRMLRIRYFEERTAELLLKKEIRCPVHLCVGQEAIPASVCANLNGEDYVFSTHRSHGHYIAKGGNLNRLMAELYGKETGCSSGHGGSMHIIEKEIGYMASSSIVAGTVPIAVGASLSIKLQGQNRVSVVFFGDGAMDEGVFYESLNIAALYKLPVVFICENNLFSTHLPISKRQSNKELYKKARAFKVKAKRVNGNNPVEIFINAKEMIECAKMNKGPSFLECMTFRWLAHVGPTPDLDIGYRKKGDVESWKKRCPIKYLKEVLYTRENMDWEKMKLIEEKIKKEIEDSILFARKSQFPGLSSLEKGVFAI